MHFLLFCGRVCPQEKQCESKCEEVIKGESVGIGRLERFVADWHMKNVKEEIESLFQTVRELQLEEAVLPGLTVAGDLAKKGLRSNNLRGIPYSRRRFDVRYS